MKLGYLYRLKEDATQENGQPIKRFFCFEEIEGRYIGQSGDGWPRFHHDSGRESCVNCLNPDDILEEVEEPK